MNATKNVAAIVPIFNPDNGLSERLDRLLEQVGLVVVVDDGSGPSQDRDSVLAAKKNLIVLRQENLGIAAALNRGIRESERIFPSLEFVITVDQDSTLAPDYVRNAIEEFESASAAGIAVGAMCAGRFNDWFVTPRKIYGDFRSTLEVAQSGMLFPMSIFRTLGYFDECLFIDCVDTEYALRMLKAGSLVLIGRNCSMAHEVGQMVYLQMFGRPVRIAGKELKFSFHSALRRYYISRNRVIVYRQHFWSDPAWILRETLFETKTTVLSLLLGPEKRRQLLAIGMGIMDGVQGVDGKVSSARRSALESLKTS